MMVCRGAVARDWLRDAARALQSMTQSSLLACRCKHIRLDVVDLVCCFVVVLYHHCGHGLSLLPKQIQLVGAVELSLVGLHAMYRPDYTVKLNGFSTWSFSFNI